MTTPEQRTFETSHGAAAGKTTPLSLVGSIMGLAGVMLALAESVLADNSHPLACFAIIVLTFGGQMTVFSAKKSRSVIFAFTCFMICVYYLMHFFHG